MSFFEMGGYGAFVWPSLGLTALVMGGLLVATLQQLHSRQRRLAELEARGTRRARRTAVAVQDSVDSAPGEAAR